MSLHSRTLSLAVLILAPVFSAGCPTVATTGRKQLMLISPEKEVQLGEAAYGQILADETLNDDPALNAILQRVGWRVAAATGRDDFAWEFNLIESDEVNAFCLPGGKIAVYTGLIPVAANDAGLAIILGHEIAHAIARHGAERMSQRQTVNLARQTLSIAAAAAGLGAVGSTATEAFDITTELGIMLPYSRAHESEADHLGLLYAAKAGYDPRQAVPLWQRMNDSADSRPPAFLSTHPNPDHRIEDFQQIMPHALDAYHAAPQQFGQGQPLPANPTT